MLALLYDVHGNLPALEAVVEDAERVGADRFLLGGDYAFAGGWPLETVERLRTLDAEWIRGNGERWTAAPFDAPDEVLPLLRRCAEILGPPPLRSWRRSRRRSRATTCSSATARRCPTCAASCPWLVLTTRSFSGAVPGARGVRPHPPRVPAQWPNGVQLLNPGSVGMPCDGDHRAAYALLHGHGRAEHRRVEYDHQASADAVRQLYGDDGEVPARRIEQARVDVS